MSSFERFSIGFISALLYPAFKCSQTDLNLENLAGLLGAILPFSVIGVFVGLYATLVEKAESDRGKLFRICMALPAFVLGLASSPQMQAQADSDSVKISCEPLSDFQQGWYDVISAITNSKRIRYYLVGKEHQKEYILANNKKYFIIAKLTTMPESGLVYDVDKCLLLTADF